jgi:hypothetical protein
MISHFTFEYLQNDTTADIKISLMSPKHKSFEDDNFRYETIAHAFFHKMDKCILLII